MSFDRYTVARMPFPCTDRNATKNRPALVLSDAAAFNAPAGHAVMAMITSEVNTPWPLERPIADLAAAGLPAPSKVRFKLFTLDHRLVRGELGKLSATDVEVVAQGLSNMLSIEAPKGRHDPTRIDLLEMEGLGRARAAPRASSAGGNFGRRLPVFPAGMFGSASQVPTADRD